MNATHNERITDVLGEESLQRTVDEPEPYEQEHQLNLDTLHLPFEVTRRCIACEAEKTHVYFGRLSIEKWITILSTDANTPFVCKACAEHRGDEGLQTSDRV